MHLGYTYKKPDAYGHCMVYYSAIPTKDFILEWREQMIKTGNMLMHVKQIHNMEKGSLMLYETKVLFSLRGI